MPKRRNGRMALPWGTDDAMGLADPDQAQTRRQCRDTPLPGLVDGLHVVGWKDCDFDALQPAWQALARTASMPNPFFEEWYLRPSLEQMDVQGDVLLALFVTGGHLAGLMPLGLNPRYHSRPLANASTWNHHNSFCGGPLVAKGQEEAFWSALLAWCDAHAMSGLFLHLPQLPTDGPLVPALRKACRSMRRPLQTVLRQERALLASELSPEAYLGAALRNKRRKELRRQRKRLSELGEVAIHRSRDGQDIDDWIDRFLALEARGWKGDGGSALASHGQTEALFRLALRSAAEQGKLERLALTIDNRPIAMLATFLAGRAGFSYKTAYDEDYGRFSPGLQLQLANLDLLDDPAMDWCDSCAAQDHSMIDHLWRERREIAWFSIPVGHGPRRMIGNIWTALEAWQWRRKA